MNRRSSATKVPGNDAGSGHPTSQHHQQILSDTTIGVGPVASAGVRLAKAVPSERDWS